MVCTSPIKLKKKPEMLFRCRKCLSCQITKRQEWAMRCVMEAETHSKNSFLTLTFNDNYLPAQGIEVRHLQLFFKRLRKEIAPIKIKYVACGEYGEKFGRPHYHVLLFGYDFEEDKLFLKKTRKGELIYRSPTLEKLWPYGISSIGTLTHSSASYVAGYVHKKFNNTDEKEAQHYVNSLGLLQNKEFIVCSKGIAREFYEKHIQQLYNHDYVVYQGKKYALPEYFSRLIDKDENLCYDTIKFRRAKHVKKFDIDECKAKDYILKQKFSKSRNLESTHEE